MPKNNTLLATLDNQLLLLNPQRQQFVESALDQIVANEHFDHMMADAAVGDYDFWNPEESWKRSYRPYNVQNGILQVPIMGVLLNRFGFQLGSWATGYTYIEKAIKRGLEDPEVKGIALVVDSPGGLVAGNFELNDFIYESRASKPIWAFVADNAYSAAFSLASAAETITVTRSGHVGSVGVVTSHLDVTKAMEDAGLKLTLVYAGKHKVDRYPTVVLSEEAKSRMQASVDKDYGVFVGLVARNRGMDEQAVRDTEALIYDAEDGIKVGFADKVGALEEELTVFVDHCNRVGEEEMTKEQEAAQAKEEAKAAQAKAVADAKAEGIAAERKRISEITALEEAKGREAVALEMALTTDLSADQMKGILAKIPVVETAKGVDTGTETGADGEGQPKKKTPEASGKSDFAKVMDASQQPNLKPEGDDQEDDKDPKAKASGLRAAYRLASGKKQKTAA